MAILAFRSPARPGLRALGSVAVPPGRKERLAIISSSDRLCGIAAYTEALRRQLSDLFEVTVFDLDQYLLRSRQNVVRRRGDAHIRAICTELRAFDAVNIQLEYGTLGSKEVDIARRLRWLASSAPRLSVSFHTVVSPKLFDGWGSLRALLHGQIRTAIDAYRDYRRNRLLSLGVARDLRRQQRRKQVTAIVHNRRDAADVRHLYGIEQVLDHPLAFLSASEAEAARARSSRRMFPLLDHLPDDASLIGVFGFLNDYKGFGTAIGALKQLPDSHHLLIFGGVHPNEIAAHQPLHPYVARLFEDAHIDTSVYRQLARDAGAAAPQLTLKREVSMEELIGPHPRDLSARIHFMGVLNTADFLTGMAICDAVVLPYLEVGQSSSGPISQALELGCRVIASRTQAFLEFARYHPDSIEFFDIGNHLELAERLRARRQYPAVRSVPEFNTETNKVIYLLANSNRSRGGSADAEIAPRPEEEQVKGAD
jgi:glycosyltransferase involved in cell wall biosynthesis